VTAAPKALLDVAGWPFLRYHLEQIRSIFPARTALLTGYGADAIEAAFAPEAKARGLVFVREAAPLGTGGALAHARAHAAERNWVANADSFADVEPREILAAWRPGLAIVVAVRVEDGADYGGIEIAAGGRVLAFREKGLAGPAWVNAGIYVLGRELMAEIPEGVSSLERDHLPRWAREGRLLAVTVEVAFRDIGTPERLALARAEFVAIRARLERRGAR
jgi:D-glycero-alpha-D-manno-heptose 1-phosphate guanylyltransferase